MGKSHHNGNGNGDGDGDGDGVAAEVPEILRLSSNPYRHMFAAFRTWLHDGVGAAVGSTLEMARAHVVAVNAASEIAPIADVPDAFIDVIPTPDQAVLRAIRDIVAALEACTLKQCLLNESGRAPWSYPPARKSVNGYVHFAGPATKDPQQSHLPAVSARTFTTDARPANAATRASVSNTAEMPPLPI
jgi:hypothetical protein